MDAVAKPWWADKRIKFPSRVHCTDSGCPGCERARKLGYDEVNQINGEDLFNMPEPAGETNAPVIVPTVVVNEAEMRKFGTGATRNSDAGRPDYEGFLSPLVLEFYGEYMQKHRVQADGTERASDNWQKGLPLTAYIKGAWRHFMHFWTRHRGYPVRDSKAAANIKEDLAALLFNISGYLHELLKAEHENNKKSGS